MDDDDPEKRIAELERQLAARGDVVGSPVGAGPAAHRTFVATAPRMNIRRWPSSWWSMGRPQR
jgi:hypothetical protein